MEECSPASTVGVSRVVCICSLVRDEVTPSLLSFTVSVIKGQSLGQVYTLCVCVCLCVYVWRVCLVSGIRSGRMFRAAE